MKTQKINSKDAVFQKFEVLKTNRNKRYGYKEFLVEGVRNINEAVRMGREIVSFIYDSDKPLSDWAVNMLKNTRTEVNYALRPPLMADLSGKEDTSELLCIVKMSDDTLNLSSLSDNPVIALFDRPSNRGNLGTIIRSCDALGVEALIITGHAVDLYDPEVVVSSMGSFFKVPIVRLSSSDDINSLIASLKDKYPDFKTVGTSSHAQVSIYDEDLTGSVMFMIGNETEGLCRAFKESCDSFVTIPMARDSYASSFNVACASTVMFYEAARQRSKKA